MQTNRRSNPVRIAIASDVYYEDLYAGVSAYARLHDWDLDVTMLRFPGYLPKQEKWDGILATVNLESTAAWLAETACPVVELLLTQRSQSANSKVVCDYRAIGRCGAQHLLELGNVQFGFYRGFLSEDSNAICEGFVDEIEAHGFPVVRLDLGMSPSLTTRTQTSRGERLEWLTDQLSGWSRPIAIMGEDDRFAVDLWMAARELGLRVPQDIAILGADDQRLLLGSVPVEISSVDVNLHEVGWRGAELLDRLRREAPNAPEPAIIRIPPKGVVLRNSTATFACDHPGVTSAALFIRQHFREPISVSDAAAHAGVSLRTLQAEYPVHVGHSVKDDILRQRIAAAQSLLERTNLKLAAVAAESGWGNAEHLCRIFQQKHGMTPNAWRRLHGNRGIASLA